ncbi:hypothetical protein ACJ73_04756 [Blastomyces percursus]|uniref:Uncharacterized protein n=1 Tax=Blastomyces percursus TaxID=1658174 RepID=A0A1J9R5W0_9EURO|nr:hypothetical protein ACJ73_04756 [Blastomyces percursus]
MEEKDLYEVAGRLCAEFDGREFPFCDGDVREYWFKNAYKTFPLPFVPVGLGVANFGTTPAKFNAKHCTDMLATLISGCTAPGKPSRFNHFTGGGLTEANGESYVIGCVEAYCLRNP